MDFFALDRFFLYDSFVIYLQKKTFMNLRAICRNVEPVVIDAGRLILRHLGDLKALHVRDKGKNNFVTRVDLRVEAMLIDAVHKLYPKHGILTEEAGEVHPTQDGWKWIIDPLDGTTNYIHGFPYFSISVALLKDDQIELGLVYDPNHNELFTAFRGSGAYVNASKRLRVSNQSSLDGALLGTAFPCRDPEDYPLAFNTLQQMLPSVAGLRRMGAASLDLAYVAAGRLDGFWQVGLKPWDIAAGALLIQEAGGLITDYQGEQSMLQSGQVVAASPDLQKNILDCIKSAS